MKNMPDAPHPAFGHLLPASGEKDLEIPRPAKRGEGPRSGGEGLFFMVAALLLLLAVRAHAGAVAACQDAFIFPEARVTVVILPYDYAVPGQREFLKTGQGLSLLVQMNVLAAILKYESVGAVDLIRATPDDPFCQPDRVWGQLIRQAGPRPHVGVVMVWGRIFKDGDQIYEQTFVRFQRGGVPQEGWRVAAGEHMFDGVLSAQATAFPTRTFSEDDLREIATLTAKYSLVRTEPRDDAPGEPLGPDLAKCLGCIDPGRPASYVIIGQNGPWSHIRNAFGKEGWLKLDTGFGAGPLSAKMPELAFIDGTTGYLQTRMMLETKAYARAADDALSSYVKTSEGASPISASTLATEMRALLAASQKNAEGAVALLDDALKLSPADAEAHNLLALAKLNRWNVSKTPDSQSRLAQDFVTAAVLDPSRTRALTNLKEFFALPVPQWSEPMKQEEIKAQIAMIDSILAKRGAQ